MKGAKGDSPLESLLLLGEWGCREDAGATAQFFPTSSHLSSFLPDTVVLEPGLRMQIREAGISPKQETVTVVLNI